MRKLMFIVACSALALSGCLSPGDKAEHLDYGGLYTSNRGTLAVGSIEVQSAPGAIESAMISYEDSAAWLRDAKEHRLRITLGGTNSAQNARAIVEDICKAFIETAPVVTGAKTE